MSKTPRRYSRTRNLERIELFCIQTEVLRVCMVFQELMHLVFHGLVRFDWADSCLEQEGARMQEAAVWSRGKSAAFPRRTQLSNDMYPQNLARCSASFWRTCLDSAPSQNRTQGGHRNRVPVVKRPELVAEHLAVLGVGDVHAAGVSYVLGKSALVTLGTGREWPIHARQTWHRPTTRYGRLVSGYVVSLNDVPTNVPHPGSHPSPRIRWRPGPQLG